MIGDKKMIRLRPYKASDAETILSWCQDEKTFYRWTAGVLGDYPITQKEFSSVENLIPFTAFDDSEILGFFTLRNPKETLDELRFGFVILNPALRGKGYGKEMLRLGLNFVFDLYGADKASIGVFENNVSAYHCYRAVGFRDVPAEIPETYHVLGEDWKCRELALDKENYLAGLE